MLILLQNNYAKKTPPECAQRVKTLYQELKLEQVYKEYEESSYQKLVLMVEEGATKANLPKQLFLEFANRIYKRNA